MEKQNNETNLTQQQNWQTKDDHIPYWEMIRPLDLKKEWKNYKMLCKKNNPWFDRWTYSRCKSKQMYMTYEAWYRHMDERIGKMLPDERIELKYYVETQMKMTGVKGDTITSEASPVVSAFIGALITLMLNEATEGTLFVWILIALFFVAYIILYQIIKSARTERAYTEMFYDRLLEILKKHCMEDSGRNI